MVRSITLWLVVVFASLAPAAAQVAQFQRGPTPPPREPMPEGQRLTAGDGDTIAIEGDARIRIVRRRPAFVRLVANSEQRRAMVIIEYLRAAGDAPTRRASRMYSFEALDGQWPLPARWEGAAATIEELLLLGDDMRPTPVTQLAVETPDVTVRFARFGEDAPAQPRAATLFFRGVNVGGGGGFQSFDEIERMQAAGRAMQGSGSGGSATFGSWMQTEAGSTGALPPISAGAPVRAGGNITPPVLIRRVEPQRPEAAVKAGIQGIVILEITIGTDGSVTDARVLRSIPLLDEEALRAVRQWRYVPTQLNGVAVPVTLTVTVPFTR